MFLFWSGRIVVLSQHQPFIHYCFFFANVVPCWVGWPMDPIHVMSKCIRLKQWVIKKYSWIIALRSMLGEWLNSLAQCFQWLNMPWTRSSHMVWDSVNSCPACYSKSSLALFSCGCGTAGKAGTYSALSNYITLEWISGMQMLFTRGMLSHV